MEAKEARSDVSHIINVNSSGGSSYTISHRAPATPSPAPEVVRHFEIEKRPTFGNITDDYHLLENMVRYAKFCEQYNVAVPQMAQSLARAIGFQNGGRCNVLIYDYLLAIPEYPPTQNGLKKSLTGEGRWCNIVCYKSQLFGVCVFPATDNVSFYFPEFSSFTPQVQQLIFTFGNKSLRYCQEKQALVFEFKSEQVPPPASPILLTATLKRKINSKLESPGIGNAKDARMDNGADEQQRKVKSEFIQLE